MKIQYCSDLHLEFHENERFIENFMLEQSAPVLILAGDIVPLHDEYLNKRFFRFISKNYKQVFWVPGNHEFYYRNISDYSNSYNIKLFNNINLVNNIELEYEGVKFIFSTLWSHIANAKAKLIEQSISDFTCIKNNDKRLKANDFNKLHADSLAFLSAALSSNKHPKTVVITHHLPSAQCNSPEHINSPINDAFCVDLTHFIEDHKANFWIYGHSHFNQKPLIIGKTMLLTNQLGYVRMNEHYQFNAGAYLAI